MIKNEQPTGLADMKKSRTREEVLENNLKATKVGDGVFNTTYGIGGIKNKNFGSLKVSFHGGEIRRFNYDGRERGYELHPALFESVECCIEYFQTIKQIEREENDWTWEKIQKCKKIDFGAWYINDTDKHLIYGKDRYGLYTKRESSKNSRKIESSDFIYERGCKFYDRNGNLLNPREY